MLILTPSHFSLSPASGPTSALDWVLSDDGLEVREHGHAQASLLPSDAEVVLALPPRAVSWHRVDLPKVGAGKLRAVLDGLLEDRLLADTGQLHYALETGGRPGQTVWVAACDKAWLQAWLQTLEAAGRPVSRIVPVLAPLGADAHPGELQHWAHHAGGQPWLGSASAAGVSCTPLPEPGSGFSDSAFGTLTLEPHLPDPSASDLHGAEALLEPLCMADPAVAGLAEHALHQRFDLVPLADWLLRSARNGWNLAQFDLSLSARARHGQRLRQALREWRSAPAWRPMRWGVAALMAVQVVGLNLSAWHERQRLDAKQQSLRQTLQQTFPGVTLVIDAPAQMRREVEQLQQGSGVLSQGDLETMLAALGDATPGQGPGSIDYATRSGRFGAWPGGPAPLASVQPALQGRGWRVSAEGEQLILQPQE